MPSSNSNLLHVLTKSLFMSYSFFSSDNKLCWDNGSKHSSPNVSVFLFSLSVWPPVLSVVTLQPARTVSCGVVSLTEHWGEEGSDES